MTSENEQPNDRRVIAAENYGEAMRNWDKVHSDWFRDEATLEEDVAAWDRRRSAFAELKSIEAELEPERPEGAGA